MEIYGTIEARNTINGALGVGGVIGGGGSCDFDTKIIPYDNRITKNTNNITALQTEVASLDSITESITDDVNENIRNIEFLEANKADKNEIPNVPSWAMQSNKPSYNASEITNDSVVTGQTVKEAFDTLYEDLDTVATETATNTTNIATNTSDINQINQNLTNASTFQSGNTYSVSALGHVGVIGSNNTLLYIYVQLPKKYITPTNISVPYIKCGNIVSNNLNGTVVSAQEYGFLFSMTNANGWGTADTLSMCQIDYTITF